MDFLRIAEIAEIADMSTETPPGVHKPGHMDLYVYNTCIEFKRYLVRNNAIDPQAIAQLDGYLEHLVESGAGVQNGILTDGLNYLIRHVGANRLPLQQGEMHTVFDRPEQAPRLREYLHRVVAAPASDIKPDSENLTRWFGNYLRCLQCGQHALVELPLTATRPSNNRSQTQVVAGIAAGGTGAELGSRQPGKRLAIHTTHVLDHLDQHHRPIPIRSGRGVLGRSGTKGLAKWPTPGTSYRSSECN